MRRDREEIEKIGKRTPYGVPKGFHEEFRQRLLATPAEATPHIHTQRIALLGGGAVLAAAAIALAIVVGTTEESHPASSFEALLAELSDDQCNALVESYNDDIFLATME